MMKYFVLRLKAIFHYGLIVAMMIFGINMPGFSQQNAGAKATPVIAKPIEPTFFFDQIEALGTTRANEAVKIMANVTEKVVEINFTDGQQVKRNDVLVRLDNNEESAELESAQALLSERQAAYKRAKDLERKKLASTAELDLRRALMLQAEGSIAAIQARINDRVIIAPFDGILGFRDLSVGTLVQPGDVITTIDDLSFVKLDFSLPAVYLSEIHLGLPITATIEAYSDMLFEGTIKTIDVRVDPTTRSFLVRAFLPNPKNILKPGLLAKIILKKNNREALIVPEEAITQRGNKHFIYVVTNDNSQAIANEKEVTIGGRRPGAVEILTGLQANELIIIDGANKVRNGKLVNILNKNDVIK